MCCKDARILHTESEENHANNFQYTSFQKPTDGLNIEPQTFCSPVQIKETATEQWQKI